MATGAKLIGRPEMQTKLRNVVKNYPTKVGNALKEEMQIEFAEVQKRTPVESGDLLSTEKLVGPFTDGGSISVLILAGGVKAPYALIVHEDLEAFHKVGQAKYIESVLMESRSFIGVRVAKRLNIADWVN
jgi:hypothetical protein